MTDTFHTLGRLTKRSEFLYVREGRYKARQGLVLQMRETPNVTGHTSTIAPIRVGFTATKRIGNAVHRNRAKRRLREVARRILPTQGRPGHDYVLIARDNTIKRPFDALCHDLEKALSSLA